MKLKINGTVYDLQAALNKATLNELMELKVKTKSADFPGVSVKSIVRTFQELATSDDPLDFLDTVDSMQNFRGMVWLARRMEGEQLTIEEANAFPLVGGLDFVDDEPEEQEPDPKALTDSDPAFDADPARE